MKSRKQLLLIGFLCLFGAMGMRISTQNAKAEMVEETISLENIESEEDDLISVSDDGTGIAPCIVGGYVPPVAPYIPTKGFDITLSWQARDGGIHPLQYNKVEIINQSTETILMTEYTDVNGNILVGYNTEAVEYYYIRVYAGGENSIVTNANGTPYIYESAVAQFIPDALLEFEWTATMLTLQGQAFQARHHAGACHECSHRIPDPAPECGSDR